MFRTTKVTARVALLALSSCLLAQKGQLPQKKVLTLEIAKKLVAAAEVEACKPECQGAIAIVDDGGYTLYAERFHDTQAPSIDLAIRKARAAALYRRPTKFFRDSVAQGKAFYSSFPQMLAVNGGVPLIVDGQVIGAIGVSGNMEGASGGRTEPITAAALEALAKLVSH